jgi:hypothetical protein
MFGAAGIAKLVRIESFRDALSDYGLVPTAAIPLLAGIIPVVELAIAVGIAIPRGRVLAVGMAATLLVIFTGAVAVNLARGRSEISCACFGAASKPLHWSLPLRNGLLIAALIGSETVGFTAWPTVAAAAGIILMTAMISVLMTFVNLPSLPEGVPR